MDRTKGWSSSSSSVCHSQPAPQAPPPTSGEPVGGGCLPWAL
uniref:Uncharacterized protein n=1 Tax=Fagus sylvatica TaxID=28930 RepID=A0A2N9EKH5_FAGSY